MDVVLEKGDVLYIPRGWWHQTSTIEGHPTIHLAIGLHASTLSDYLTWLSATLLTEDVALRRSLAQIAEDPRILRKSLETFAQKALDSAYLDTYANEHRKLATARAPDLRQIIL
jgi:ribosomal protein L16 Arg81 hydroxylase